MDNTHLKNNGRKIVIGSILCLVLFLLLYSMGQWLIPFIIGLILAYAFHVPSNKISKHLKCSHTVSAFLIVSVIISIFTFFTIFMIPLTKNAILVIINKLPKFVETVPLMINSTIKNIMEAFAIHNSEIDVSTTFQKYLSHAAESIPNNIMGFLNTGVTLIYIVMFVFMTPIITFYLLKDWHKIEKHGKFLLRKFFSNVVVDIMNNINKNLGKYIIGQLCVCSVLTILYTIALFFIGINEYIVCGIFSGFISIAPFFGPFIGFVITLVMAIDDYSSWVEYMLTGILYIVIPFLDSNFITPKLIGTRTGIQPFWILFSICATVSILGVSGIFISVPIAVVLSTICKDIMKKLH